MGGADVGGNRVGGGTTVGGADVGVGNGDTTGTTVCAELSPGFGSTTVPASDQPSCWLPTWMPMTVAVT